MAIGQPLYTGKDTGVELKGAGELERARTKFHERVIGAEQEAYKRKTKREDDFLKAMDIDPLVFITDNARREQSEMISAYNDEFGQRYKDKNGVLSETDKLDMQTAKALMEAKQNAMFADQEMYVKDRDLIRKDMGQNYDEAAFKQAEDDYRETGVYDKNAVSLKPKDPSIEFQELKLTGKGDVVSKTTTEGGKSWLQTSETNISVDEAKQQAAARIMNNPAYLKWAVTEFGNLSDEEKVEYLDTNKDGAVSSSEKQAATGKVQAGNPILQWAVDNSYQSLIKDNPNVPKAITATKTPAEKDAARGVYTAFNKKYTAPSASRQTYGKTQYDAFYTYSEGNLSVQVNIPEGSILHGKSIDKPLAGKKTIKGTVVGYDAITRKVVFNVGDDFQVGAFQDVNNVSVPIDQLPDEYLDLRIKTADGIQRVGDVIGAAIEKKTIGGF